MSRSLARRGNQGLGLRGNQGLELLILAIAGIAILVILLQQKSKSATAGTAGQYKNLEEWSISYNEDGLPVKIVVHRNASRT